MSRNENKKIFRQIFDNKKFVFIFSLGIAFILWCYVSISQTSVTKRTYTDIPVQFNTEALEDTDFIRASEKTYKVDVTVKGYSYLLNDSFVSSSNITVTAEFEKTPVEGENRLKLTASLQGTNLSKIEIESISETYVYIELDRLASREFTVNPDNIILDFDENQLPDGYTVSGKRANTETVTLTGRKKVLDTVTDIRLKAVVSGELSGTIELTPSVSFMQGSVETRQLDIDVITPGNTELKVLADVSLSKVFETSVDFINVPGNYQSLVDSVKVEPASEELELASEEIPDYIKGSRLVVGEVDFNSLDKIVNYLNLPVTLPDGETRYYHAVIDLSDCEELWLTLTVRLPDDAPAGTTVSTQKISGNKLIGKSVYTDYKNTENDKLATATADLSGIPNENGKYTPGVYTVPVLVELTDIGNECWILDTKPTVEITIPG